MMRLQLTGLLVSLLSIPLHAQNTSGYSAPQFKNIVRTTAWGDQGNGTYINPILNADFSDPDVIRVNDKYYMIASDFHFIGMQVLESEDMVNWKYISQVFSSFDFPEWDRNERYAGGSWAPSIRHHDGLFWIYFCTPDEGLFMTTAKDPAGPWAPLHLVKNVPKWEDPCPFWDEDGNAYLGRSQHGAGPIIIHKMSPDGRTLLDDGVTVYTGPVAEGTKIFKKDGYYYISIPEGGVGTGWQTVLRSRNIYGPYEGKRVLEQGSTMINGPHQGAIVDTPDGEWWFYHFQQDRMLGRVVHLQPMYWDEDGWPVIGVDIDRNGVGEPVLSWRKPDCHCHSVTASLATDDDFSSETLSLQWQFNHNPDNTKWSLTDKPGFLTLYANKAYKFSLARNTLTQKTIGYIGKASALMNVSEMKEGQRAGFACIGQENTLLGVKCINGDKVLYLSKDTRIPRTKQNKSEEIPIAVLNDEKTVCFKVSIDMIEQSWQLYYSLDGQTYYKAGDPFNTVFGNWKGPRVGLFSYNTKGSEGSVSFDWFKYKHDGPNTDAKSTNQ